MSARWLWVVALAWLAGCDDASDPDVGAAGGDETIAFDSFKGDNPISPRSVLTTRLGDKDGPGALLELVVTDVWGRLPDRKATLIVQRVDGPSVKLIGYLEPVILRLQEPGRYRLEASIPDHLTEVMFFEVGADGSMPVPADQVTHWSFSADARTLNDADVKVHSLYLGLEHRYFAASGPAPRRGNEIELFDNGQEAFKSLADDFAGVQESAHISLWLMKEEFELTRDPDYAAVSEAERRQNTILAWLDRLQGTRRVLLNEYWGDSDFINEVAVLDDGLQARAERAGDGIELMLQPNETEVPYREAIPLRDDEWSYRDRLLEVSPAWAERDFLNEETFKPSVYDRDVRWTDLQIGSWHQKFYVLDDRIAYVGGMNMNHADWDTGDLEVFNPLRMPIDADRAERDAVAAGRAEPGTRPRRDYMTRVQGRLVDDVQALFQKRWDLAIMRGDAYSEGSTPFTRTVPVDPRGQVPGVEAQLNVTTPMPFWEHSNLEGMRKMIESAESYIYIEDQYFRMPVLNEVIHRRMNDLPWLKLIVFTVPVDYSDPGRKWTAISHREFQQKFPERYLLLTLKASDFREIDGKVQGTFVGVDLHSKMLIVDDVMMSVGSCNKNNRGLIYEGEANLLIRDAEFVGQQRRRIWRDLVGPGHEAELEDVDGAFELFKRQAEYNQRVYDIWDDADFELPPSRFNDSLVPQGRVFPLDVPYDWWFDVGTDTA
ncbi:MAG: phosphatidylserine/phosphatidylglycerophosphate/cardiolipin synthase family protein [Myxococcales bacterium]|nr:phosphatidylserine/phosphatidylglycerophosphate/cardiolipin synthase family protein [Myxococcales bacterium]